MLVQLSRTLDSKAPLDLPSLLSAPSAGWLPPLPTAWVLPAFFQPWQGLALGKYLR